MALVSVRKFQVSVDEIFRDRGPVQERPLLLANALAVVANPYAGRYEADVMPFMAELRALGSELARRACEAVGGPDAVQAYGKGAIVGEGGELEHGALWHEAGGWPLRELVHGKAIIPAAKTVGPMGTRLIVPMGHIEEAFVRSHLTVTQMHIWDGPRHDEIVFGLAVSTGPRIEARCGGLAAPDRKESPSGG